MPYPEKYQRNNYNNRKHKWRQSVVIAVKPLCIFFRIVSFSHSWTRRSHLGKTLHRLVHRLHLMDTWCALVWKSAATPFRDSSSHIAWRSLLVKTDRAANLELGKGFYQSIFEWCRVISLDMVILGRILVFFGLVAILHAGYSAVQCKYFVLNKELSEIKHKHLHRLYYCNGANVKLSLYLKYRDLFIPFHNFSMS